MRLEYGWALTPMECIEAALLLIALGASLIRPQLFRQSARSFGHWLDCAAQRRLLSCSICFLLPIVLRLTLLPIYPQPEPLIHDEYSFVLQAQTFASGKVTNAPLLPGDPLEETFVLPRPTRQSIYPPSQGLALALGIRLFRSAWAGVLLAVGAMCALLCWAIGQWIPPRWAFRCGLYAALAIGVLSYWTNSYWGGAVNASGGLLMWGAMPRLRRSPSVLNALLFSAGFLIAVDSRPLESILFILIALAWLGQGWVALAGSRTRRNFQWAPAAAAFCLCVAAGAVLNGWYNARVTGNPLITGYSAARTTLAVPQSFYFQQPLQPVKFDFADQRSEYDRQTQLWLRGRSLTGFFASTGGKIRRAWAFFARFALLPVLFALPVSLKSRGCRLAIALVAALAAVHVAYHSYYPHYDGVDLGAIALLLVQSWRHLRLWRPFSRPAGLALCRMLPAIAIAAVLLPVAGRAWDGARAPRNWYRREFNFPPHRSVLIARLRAAPGKQLLLVRYSAEHNPDDDWIFNSPDPDQSQLVIARENDPRSDAELMKRFPDRQCWIVDADSTRLEAKPCRSQITIEAVNAGIDEAAR